MLADHLGADAFEIIEMENRNTRVNVLNTRSGVDGHCISVDPWFMVHAAPSNSALIKTARMVNDSKPQFVVGQVVDLANQYEFPVIGCLGLSYKPDVDDFRESPSLEIVHRLLTIGIGKVLACDPYASPQTCP